MVFEKLFTALDLLAKTAIGSGKDTFGAVIAINEFKQAVEESKKPIELKFKKLAEEAELPEYAHPGEDACVDLKAISYNYDKEKDYHCYGTGIAVEIPKGYVGLVFPRSSNRNKNAYMANHVGVIDSGYRGEIMVTFKNRDWRKPVPNTIIKKVVFPKDTKAPYEIGDKVAQFMIVKYPMINPVEVTELSESDRGEGGHGSSGK